MKAILSAATGTGAGKLFQVSTSIHTIQVVFTGTISALSVAIEGSIDGANIFALETHELSSEELAAKKVMFHIVNKLVEYVRVNITVLTGAGAVTVYHSPADAASRQVD